MIERSVSKALRDGATEQMIRRYVWKLYPTRAQSAERRVAGMVAA